MTSIQFGNSSTRGTKIWRRSSSVRGLRAWMRACLCGQTCSPAQVLYSAQESHGKQEMNTTPSPVVSPPSSSSWKQSRAKTAHHNFQSRCTMIKGGKLLAHFWEWQRTFGIQGGGYIFFCRFIVVIYNGTCRSHCWYILRKLTSQVYILIFHNLCCFWPILHYLCLHNWCCWIKEARLGTLLECLDMLGDSMHHSIREVIRTKGVALLVPSVDFFLLLPIKNDISTMPSFKVWILVPNKGWWVQELGENGAFRSDATLEFRHFFFVCQL